VKLTKQERTLLNERYGGLKTYLNYTYYYAESMGKLIYAEDGGCCFNTGLFTATGAEIYCVLQKSNHVCKEGTPLPYYVHAFVSKKKTLMLKYKFPRSPLRVLYFEKPHLLMFDSSLKVVPNITQIVRDNQSRLPAQYRQPPFNDMDDQAKQAVLQWVEKAIRKAVNKSKNNYRLVVPQYYRGHLQFLLPLALGSDNPMDCALVLQLEKDRSVDNPPFKPTAMYTGYKVLDLNKAYWNARMITKPNIDWLAPTAAEFAKIQEILPANLNHDTKQLLHSLLTRFEIDASVLLGNFTPSPTPAHQEGDAAKEQGHQPQQIKADTH